MYDLSIPADKPGRCPKCHGTGVYSWGATINGQPQRSGDCHSCRGTGQQSARQIARNYAYNVHKIRTIFGD